MSSRPLSSIVLAATFLATAWSPARAESVAEPRPGWTAQVDLLTTALGYVHVQIERVLTPSLSLYAGPHLKLFEAPFGERGDLTGLGGEVGVRWYLTGTAPEGAWLLARGVLARVQSQVPEEAARLGGYGSALVGYTAIVGGRLVLSGGAGVQYIDYGVAGRGTRGVLPALHTAVGAAF